MSFITCASRADLPSLPHLAGDSHIIGLHLPLTGRIIKISSIYLDIESHLVKLTNCLVCITKHYCTTYQTIFTKFNWLGLPNLRRSPGTLRKHQITFRPGLHPTGGAYDAPPNPLVGWGGEYCSPCPTPSPRSQWLPGFWRLGLGAFGAWCPASLFLNFGSSGKVHQRLDLRMVALKP